MDKEKLFGFIMAVSVAFMLAGSLLVVFGGVNENTAVKTACTLLGGVLSVLSAFCGVLAICIRDDK